MMVLRWKMCWSTTPRMVCLIQMLTEVDETVAPYSHLLEHHERIGVLAGSLWCSWISPRSDWRDWMENKAS
jgi:hypothetical protein